MSEGGHVYFHAPCFDGVVSAVLACDLLRWTAPALHPVGYEVREAWLETRLQEPSAVVDFLFHPRADFWVDHDGTTYVNEIAAKYHSEHRRPAWIYDSKAGSCAGLMFGRFPQLADRRELAAWAEKIDAARYESVHEAVFGAAPALVISRGLAVGDSLANSVEIVRRLLVRSLDVVAEDTDVRERFEIVQKQATAAADQFSRSARLEAGDVVVADIDGDAGAIRYAPYLSFPNARYSVVLYRMGRGAKITAMRNPWREFRSVPLGALFKSYGGGGHERVASLLIPEEKLGSSQKTLKAIVHELVTADRTGAASDA